jgi:hypothetical protein
MIVDTAGLFPEGKGFVMTCSGIPAERVTRGTVFWDFEFATELEGSPASYRESVPIWLAGPVFKALGFKEVGPGRYDVEPTQAPTRKLKCDIVHEVVKDKPYARMKNMVAIAEGSSQDDQIPF